MRISEAVAMFSTGALLTIGAMHFFGGNDSGGDAPEPVADAGAQVTRAATDLTALEVGDGATRREDRVNQIVALSQQPPKPQDALSPKQREAIAFFERIARQQNEGRRSDDGGDVGQALRFNNMTVDRLNVRYYYTVDVPFDALDRAGLMRSQKQLVMANLCTSEAIATLMKDYGFRYSYHYQSADGRFAGALHADKGACE